MLKEKSCMCFVELEKGFDRVLWKVLELVMRMNGMPEILVRSVICLYEGATTRVRVDSEVSEEFRVKVGMHQGSVLSHFLFALVLDVVVEFAREDALCELLYADDLVPTCETVERLRNKLLKWKETFESKGLKVNLVKTTVVVCSCITQDGLSKS